jgi:excisionase family DNA binding protein
VSTEANETTLLSIPAVAELLAVSVPTVRRLIARGEVPAVRIGHSVRVSPDELRAWLFRPEAR